MEPFPSRPVELFQFVKSLVAATQTSYFSFTEGQKTNGQITHQSERQLSLSLTLSLLGVKLYSASLLKLLEARTARRLETITATAGPFHTANQPTARGYLFLSAIKGLRLLSGSVAG